MLLRTWLVQGSIRTQLWLHAHEPCGLKARGTLDLISISHSDLFTFSLFPSVPYSKILKDCGLLQESESRRVFMSDPKAVGDRKGRKP